MEEIIKIQGLKKYFKEVKAVDDISFQVEKGELFAFLGINGAGKSTTVNMLCTLFLPTAGEIEICGFAVGKQDAKIRKRIGVVWQNNCLDGRLSVKENLYVRGALYGKNRGELKRTVEGICEKLQLGNIENRRYEKLSGGQKRRCEIAAALINRPEILFLDEPTTGLDPATRKLVWESISTLQKEENMTVFLTTHYMEEAAKASHIAVIDAGKIKETGTPYDLKEKYAGDTLRLVPDDAKEKVLEKILRDELYIPFKRENGCYKIKITDSKKAIPVLKRLENEISGFEVIQGTMDDVFLNITGKTLESAEEVVSSFL